MSFSNLQQNNDDDIRLSNVFRHHLVRSLSPQEGNTRNNPLTGILDEEPMKKEERKSKIMNTELFNSNENLSLKTGTIFIKHLKIATIFTDAQKCFICHIEFKHLKNLKHSCKICGKAVCSKCSKKKRINGRRGCDICFWKIKNKAQGLRRKEFLKSKDRMVIEFKKDIKKFEIIIETVSRNTCEKNNQIIEDEKKQNAEYFNLTRETEKEEELFQKRRENNIRLRKAIEVDKSIYINKVKENEELVTKINFLTMDLSSKMDIIASKNKMLQELKQTEKKYNELYSQTIDVNNSNKTFPIKNENSKAAAKDKDKSENKDKDKAKNKGEDKDRDKDKEKNKNKDNEKEKNKVNEKNKPILENLNENEDRNSQRKNLLFKNYENELSLSKITEHNESNLSGQNNLLLTRKKTQEEKKE